MKTFLTHNDIAVPPQVVDFPAPRYDHASQKNIVESPNLTGMGTPTIGGTRTFDFKGQPSDSDQDMDRSS